MDCGRWPAQPPSDRLIHRVAVSPESVRVSSCKTTSETKTPRRRLSFRSRPRSEIGYIRSRCWFRLTNVRCERNRWPSAVSFGRFRSTTEFGRTSAVFQPNGWSRSIPHSDTASGSSIFEAISTFELVRLERMRATQEVARTRTSAPLDMPNSHT